MNSIIDWETVDGNRAWMDAIRQELSEMTAEMIHTEFIQVK